jgi:anti-sigma B factor antagonist
MHPADIQVRQCPGVAILDLHGELNADLEGQLRSAYAEAERNDPRAVLLNFGDVDYINSTGIALIVGLLARARTAGRRLLACGLSEHYQKLFAITRLADFIAIYPDEAKALASLSRPVSSQEVQ